MLEITTPYLKQLGVICAAHLENERPDGADRILKEVGAH